MEFVALGSRPAVNLPAIVAVMVAVSLTCPILGAKRERSAARTCGQVRLDAASVTVRDVLTSIYSAHQVGCSNVRVVRDEEAAGSNPATPTSSEGIRSPQIRLTAGGE